MDRQGMDPQQMNRRTFVSAAVGLAGGVRLSRFANAWDTSHSSPEIDTFIRDRMDTYNIAGVSRCKK